MPIALEYYGFVYHPVGLLILFATTEAISSILALNETLLLKYFLSREFYTDGDITDLLLA